MAKGFFAVMHVMQKKFSNKKSLLIAGLSVNQDPQPRLAYLRLKNQFQHRLLLLHYNLPKQVYLQSGITMTGTKSDQEPTRNLLQLHVMR